MGKETTGTTTPAGETYKADRLRALEATCELFRLVATAGYRKEDGPKDYTDYLTEQFAEVRREATETTK